MKEVKIKLKVDDTDAIKATKDKLLFKSVTITSTAPKKPRIIPPHCNLDKFSFK